jgi:hypothetical protein
LTLDLSEVKKRLQDHLQEGLLLVVGTGLSSAEGVPGMGALAEHLKKVIPRRIGTTPDPGWEDVVASLDGGDHLETAMGKHVLHMTTVEAIVVETANLVGTVERQIIEAVLEGRRVLPFSTFAAHLFKAAKKFHLITPNYDRLIEVATEAAGIGVDCRFFGYLYGNPDPKRSADAHRESFIAKGRPEFRFRPCLCVHKPHGSLDWFEIDGKVVRCPVPLNRAPVIITPGTSKYRESFRRAFDEQRVAGIRGTESASRVMFVGYGFNDDHLEHGICPGLRLCKPSVILAKELTTNAKLAIERSSGTDVMALSAVSGSDLRTRISNSRGDELIVDEELWSLEGFNKGVI